MRNAFFALSLLACAPETARTDEPGGSEKMPEWLMLAGMALSAAAVGGLTGVLVFNHESKKQSKQDSV